MSKNTYKCHKISLTKLVYAKHGENEILLPFDRFNL